MLCTMENGRVVATERRGVMKVFVSIALCMVLVTAGLGLYGVSTHEDIVRYPDGRVDLSGHTGVIAPASMCGTMEDSEQQNEFQMIAEQPIVAVVQPTGRIQQRYNATLTDLLVKEVVKGDLAEGEVIQYLSRSYFQTDVIAFDFEVYSGTRVNLMNPDYEYLVVMDVWPIPEGWRDDGNRYYMTTSLTSYPYFCLTDLPNTLAQRFYPGIELAYYEDLRDNKIFPTSQQQIDGFYKLKQKVLRRFGITAKAD